VNTACFLDISDKEKKDLYDTHQDAAFVATKAAKDAVLVAAGKAPGGSFGGGFKKRT